LTNAPTLTTDRLVLRAHTRADFGASAQMWADPRVAQFIGGVPSSREASWSRLMRYFGMWSMLGYGYWAVTLKESGGLIGEVGLANFHRTLEPHPGDMPEAGWAFAPALHGHGYALEAVTAALAWADTHLGPKSFCMIDSANAASIKLAQRVGYSAPQPAHYAGKPTTLWVRSPS
jgi:RimJ/RimL family protein N-acetyltransferase